MTDYSPLRVPKKWKAETAAALPAGVPLLEADADDHVRQAAAASRFSTTAAAHHASPL